MGIVETLLAFGTAAAAFALLVGITHNLSYRWGSNTGGTPLDLTVSTSADGEINLEVSVAGGATDFQIALAFVAANLKSLWISCDVDITLETNSSSSPAQTISITANKPLTWYFGSGITNPITTTVTTAFLTRAAGSTATFQFRALVDI